MYRNVIINVDLSNVHTVCVCEWVSEYMCVQHINSIYGHENCIFMKNDLSLMRKFIIRKSKKKE